MTSIVLVVMGLAACSGVRQRDSWREPRLVVVLVVDQMRSDYLARFADQFEGGLARLNREGIFYTDAHHGHALTYTAPGHASLATGVYPRKHGIVGNSWWSSALDRSIYAVEDTFEVVGAPGMPGSSPALMLRDPLASWLKAAQPLSRVYSVALKDRAAVVMAGPHADAAYWFADGRFVTSASYIQEVPAWVTAFNASPLVDSYFPGGWDRLLPETSYGASREDDFPSEADGIRTTFPHFFEGSGPGPEYYASLANSPFGDELAFTFAQELIDEEGLGDDRTTDLLMISASSADLIGHAYGPYSQEVQDYYLRLDRMLQAFFETLDRSVGREEYVVALTSDHGVLPMPEELTRRGVAAGRVNEDEILRPAVEAARQRLGLGVLPVVVADGITLKYPPGSLSDSSLTAIRRAIADELRRREEIADVFTRDELVDGDTPDRPFLEAYRRSYLADRSPDLLVRYQEHLLPSASRTGTSHGSPYAYDTHVPLVFLNAALPSARYTRRVHAVDLAPTLAALMGIGMPRDLDGQLLQEVLDTVRGSSSLP